MNAGDFDNYWVQSSKAKGPQSPTTPVLQIKTINGVEPLDEQFGVADLQTVPDALCAPLFDQPGDMPLHTYAILDAAKIPNLPEALETSGLAHQCLFKGVAFDDLKDVAPWIVKLEDGNTFTRNLFTRSDALWHHWDAEPGIYLRSDATLDELWTHFRRFTKVRDDTDALMFFRFWDPATAQIYLTGVQSDATRIHPFFGLPNQQKLHLIALTRNSRALCMIGPVVDHGEQRPQLPLFNQSDKQLLEGVTYHMLAVEISDWLQIEYADKFHELNPQAAADHIVETGRQLGFKLKEEFAFLGQMMATSGAWFVHKQYPAALCALLQSPQATRLQNLVDNYATEHAKTPQAEILAHWEDVQAHLTAIPPADCVTPQQFRIFCQQFLTKTAADVAPAIAATRHRLGTLKFVNQSKEGKAMILTLIYGPRFFEDPFHPWAQLPADEAIDAAWTMIVG